MIPDSEVYAASVAARSIDDIVDRNLIRNIIIDYRYIRENNDILIGIMKDFAAELECIPEKEYIMKALKERKASDAPTKVWYDKGAGAFYLNFDHIPEDQLKQTGRIVQLIER